MSHLINWDTTFTFDLDPRPAVTLPISLPTYGNYGGLGYSGGKFGQPPTGPILSDKKLPDNVDALDYLFYRHDIGVTINQDAADLALVRGIANLTDRQLADPEAELYAGLTTIAISARLLIDNPNPFLARALLPYLGEALENIVSGIQGLKGGHRADALEWLVGTVDDLQSIDFPGRAIDRVVDQVDAYLDYVAPAHSPDGWLFW